MDRVQAWEVLNDADQCGNLTMEQFRKLLVRAGYSAEVVRKASLQRGWDRLSAGVEV